MFQLAFSLLFIFLLVNFCHVKDMYDMGVDEIFSSMIGPMFKVKKTTHNLKFNFSRSNTTGSSPRPRVRLRFFNQPEFSENSTERNDYYVTRHSRKRSMRPGSLSKKDLDAEALIQSPEEKPIPDFNVDPFQVLSRRFDDARNQFMQYRGKQALREVYFQYEYRTHIRAEKRRVLSIQEQFVYESRYKLLYAQRLRKKYKRRVAFQLGYSFALMRNMKQQQHVIFSTMHSNRRNYTTFFHFVKMYERIIRLDIDLKDLIKYIKYLDFMITFHNASERPRRYRRAKGFIRIENDSNETEVDEKVDAKSDARTETKADANTATLPP